MNIVVKNIRVEAKCNSTLFVDIIYDVCNVTHVVHTLNNLNLGDIDTIKDICTDNNKAILNSKHDKFRQLCEFKMGACKGNDIAFVDKTLENAVSADMLADWLPSGGMVSGMGPNQVLRYTKS